MCTFTCSLRLTPLVFAYTICYVYIGCPSVCVFQYTKKSMLMPIESSHICSLDDFKKRHAYSTNDVTNDVMKWILFGFSKQRVSETTDGVHTPWVVYVRTTNRSSIVSIHTTSVNDYYLYYSGYLSFPNHYMIVSSVQSVIMIVVRQTSRLSLLVVS